MTNLKTVHTVTGMSLHKILDLNDLRSEFEHHFRVLGEKYEIILKTPSIEVRSYAPNKHCPFEILTTFGLSKEGSSIPESWQNEEEMFNDQDWNELMLCLDTDTTQTDRLWAAQLLVSVGECAHKENRYLAQGQFFELIHTPEQPWRAAVITTPKQTELSKLSAFRTRLSQRCYWLSVLPVLKEEITVLKQEGFQAFEKQLLHNHVNEIFMPQRLSFTIPASTSLMYA